MIGRKLLGNSFSLLVNRLTQSITTFVLVASIARILGPYELGQYMLAFSYYYVFMTLTSQGFKTLFTRELARNGEETPVYLISGSLLQLIFSIIGYVVLVIVVLVLPYSVSTSTVCYVMGLTIIPFSLSNITEAVFQAHEKMHLIAISTVPIYILRLVLVIWAMSLKYNVSFVSAILVISETIILFIEWALVAKFVKYKWKIDWKFMWRTTLASRTFLFIEGISVLKGRMQVLILSLLGGELVVGLYGAIIQLMQPFEIISYSLVIAFFPKMSKATTSEPQKQCQVAENIVEMLLLVALPFIVGLLFIGSDLLLLIYRDPSFTQATLALKVIAVGLITSAFIRPLSYVLVANGFEQINLWEVFVTTTLGGFLSVFLVSQYQLNGAASAVLATQIISLCIYMYVVYNRLFSLKLWRVTRCPILISSLMLVIFWLLQKLNLNILITIVVASLAYVLMISILGVYTIGGFSVVRDKLLPTRK